MRPPLTDDLFKKFGLELFYHVPITAHTIVEVTLIFKSLQVNVNKDFALEVFYTMHNFHQKLEGGGLLDKRFLSLSRDCPTSA